MKVHTLRPASSATNPLKKSGSKYEDYGYMIHTNMGPPKFLAVYQGSAHVSKETKQNIEAAKRSVVEALIGNPGSIGTMDRYQDPFISAYDKKRESLSKGGTTAPECLQTAVYAARVPIGPEVLCQILSVFGALYLPIRK